MKKYNEDTWSFRFFLISHEQLGYAMKNADVLCV